MVLKEQAFQITAEEGLHARPATLLVHKASQYQSEVELVYKGRKVNLKSIMGVMSLGIPMGAEIKVTASGRDEDRAIEGLAEVINEHLGE